MFHRFTSASRIRLAAAFALGYALCVASPAAALAINGPANAPAHCMTEYQGVAATHIHMADTSHHAGAAHHPDAAPGKAMPDTANSPAKCCGLFGVTAIPQAQTVIALPAIIPAKCRVAAADSLFGQGPGRIDRPPISLVLL
ncbi:MAG: hypothetical protein AB7T86_00225 [Xanthobacteraceae bacterium]|uniref:hypothetical protein n=1 Tax=Pseudolabrys sp. TaxID=1960880 RepID=UPI003D128E2F